MADLALDGELHPGMNGVVRQRVVLIRHGESEANIQLMEGGGATAADTGLTFTGRMQAHAVRGLLEAYGGTVEVSPLFRAQQTLGGYADTVTISHLRERHRRADGTKYEELIDDFEARVAAQLRRWKDKDEGSITYVVTHSLFIAECIRQLFRGARGAAFTHLSNGSLTVFDYTDSGVEFQMINAVHHLDPDERTGGHTHLLMLPRSDYVTVSPGMPPRSRRSPAPSPTR